MTKALRAFPDDVCSLPRADPDLEKPEGVRSRVAHPNESVHTGSGKTVGDPRYWCARPVRRWGAPSYV